MDKLWVAIVSFHQLRKERQGQRGPCMSLREQLSWAKVSRSEPMTSWRWSKTRYHDKPEETRRMGFRKAYLYSSRTCDCDFSISAKNGLCSLEEAGCGFCQLGHILNMLKSHLYIELSMFFWCCMLCVFATALLYLGDRCSWSSNIKSCIYSAKFLQMLTFGKWHSFLVVEK